MLAARCFRMFHFIQEAFAICRVAQDGAHGNIHSESHINLNALSDKAHTVLQSIPTGSLRVAVRVARAHMLRQDHCEIAVVSQSPDRTSCDVSIGFS